MHPNDDATLTVRDLRAGARIAAEKRFPGGSPGGSDKRFQARELVDEAFEEAFRLVGERQRSLDNWPPTR